METGLYLTGWSKFMKTKPVAELGQYEGLLVSGAGAYVAVDHSHRGGFSQKVVSGLKSNGMRCVWRLSTYVVQACCF